MATAAAEAAFFAFESCFLFLSLDFGDLSPICRAPYAHRRGASIHGMHFLRARTGGHAASQTWTTVVSAFGVVTPRSVPS